jgi:SAM-dependent methyltransferase
VLAQPGVYEFWSQLVGAERARNTLVREHVRPWTGARVLDLGCGPGDLVRYLGAVEYVGIDVSRAYIDRAQRRFGDRAEFRVGDATTVDDDLFDFDLVIAFGVVHHLDDEGGRRLYDEAAAALSAGGRVVTVDPAFVPGQPRLARLAISADRGHRVRAATDYPALAETAFTAVGCTIRSDLLRIPYTHCIVEGTKP